jgi:peptidoglycan/LPS O-acetylase OafA/YrhL
MSIVSFAAAAVPDVADRVTAKEMPVVSPVRWIELDSLRGVASLVVFAYHCIFILQVYPEWVKTLLKTPLTLFIFGGHQAVILFFVLSGFVLYLPYGSKRGAPSYKVFVIRRICRIYLPYIVSVFLVLFAYLCFFNHSTPAGLSKLYGWKDLSGRDLIWSIGSHVLFIGFFNRDVFNGVTWTLAEEMRISLIFPLIAIAIQRVRPRTVLLTALSCSALVACAVIVSHHRSPWETIHYASLFALGALLAANLETARAYWQNAAKAERLGWLVASLIVCAYVPALATAHPHLVREELADWLIALPTSVIILASLSEPWFRKCLRIGVLEHCGRMSYGIYLFHLPILFVLVNLLWTAVPHMVVYGVALILTLLSADLFHRHVEVPCIDLGKRLTTNQPQLLRER